MTRIHDNNENAEIEVIRSLHDIELNKVDFKDIFKLPIMYLKECRRKGIL